MESYDKFTTINFDEHPYQTEPSSDKLVVTISGAYDPRKYAEAIFSTILTIRLSELSPFLDAQCKAVTKPIKWLNQLERLIKYNIDAFDSSQLKHRHTKLISQIDLKRNDLEKLSTPSLTGARVIEYNSGKVFSFFTVKDQLTTYETFNEKIAYLNDQIFDYLQSPPVYFNNKSIPFDQLCQIEIDRLEKHESLRIKNDARKKGSITPHAKLPFNGELKILCDVYFKMMHKKTKGGEPMISWTISQTAEHICNNYCEPDGSSLSLSTVKTYLSPSRPESRPKSDAELILDE